jgi:FKBP-type peptidyl-prolyl cis-trans isomerase
MVSLSLLGCSTVAPQDPGLRLENKEPGLADILANNRLRPGVLETATGLQYEILREGAGPKPSSQDRVHILYTMHILGSSEILDKTIRNEIPTVFPLESVISGFSEGLQLMSVGSQYRLYIPPALGFGDTPPKPVGPNDILVFDIELVEVERRAPAH